MTSVISRVVLKLRPSAGWVDRVMHPATLAVLLLMFSTTHAAAPKPGDAPRPYAGTTIDGKQVMLADFPGKAVVITFWATWCQYCLKELPILHGIQKAVGPDHVQVIAVNIEDRAVFRRLAKKMEPFELLLTYDPGEKGRRSYGVHGIPHMVIIGKDGKIDKIFRGYDESLLDEIVNSINRATGARQ